MLTRGPVRPTRPHSGIGHPYSAPPNNFNINGSQLSSSYESGRSSSSLGSPDVLVSNSSSPETLVSNDYFPSLSSSYSSSSSSCHERISFIDRTITDTDLSRLLNASELPDSLSDFILKYSWNYLASLSAFSSSDTDFRRKMSTNSEVSQSTRFEGESSQMISFPADHITVADDKLRPVLASRKSDEERSAKERLCSLIDGSAMDEAWAWMCKSAQWHHFRDKDGDSLLHIVVYHKDLAKTCALVEQMLKTAENQTDWLSRKPFDLPNRLNETPLFLAVQKRCEELVSYLLEAGACPNTQTKRPEMDGPLHYASARGMCDIVRALCTHNDTDINLVNGLGLTPLLCAFKNHGVIDEDSQCLVNNKPVIRELLRGGADCFIPDATNGKTVIHYAVDRLDPELIQLVKVHGDRDSLGRLMNTVDFYDDSPMTVVQHYWPQRVDTELHLQSKMLHMLMASGAIDQQHQ